MGKKRLQSVQQRQTGFIERKIPIIVLACIILVASVAVYYVATQGSGGSTNQNNNNQNTNNNDNNNSDTTLPNGNETSSTTIKLTTSMGNIVIKLYDDMPITSANFKNLTEHGIYDGTIFHRVVADFVVQGGDATSKGITVPTILDELPTPRRHSNIRGSVAMAKKPNQNDSATSQFYINLVDNSASLDSNYSVFGRVIEGMSVLDTMGSVLTDGDSSSPTYQRPLQAITLFTAEVIGQP